MFKVISCKCIHPATCDDASCATTDAETETTVAATTYNDLQAITATTSATHDDVSRTAAVTKVPV